MPEAGQILLHKNFIFEDNTLGIKLVVVLNTCENNEVCLVVKTTSQSKHYARIHPGCNSMRKCFCIYAECQQGFDTETFVQLDQIYPINVDQLLNSKQITFVDHLEKVCFANLKRCLRNYREDIPKAFWALIYSPGQ
jgi:hypothetical protein